MRCEEISLQRAARRDGAKQRAPSQKQSFKSSLGCMIATKAFRRMKSRTHPI
jgi:hypothetical protein